MRACTHTHTRTICLLILPLTWNRMPSGPQMWVGPWLTLTWSWPHLHARVLPYCFLAKASRTGICLFQVLEPLATCLSWASEEQKGGWKTPLSPSLVMQCSHILSEADFLVQPGSHVQAARCVFLLFYYFPTSHMLPNIATLSWLSILHIDSHLSERYCPDYYSPFIDSWVHKLRSWEVWRLSRGTQEGAPHYILFECLNWIETIGNECL